MSFGKCALCHSVTNLRRSHAIPDSFFRKLFSKDSGKAIKFVDDESTKIEYSKDSWWAYQLCKECEELVNQSYEKYSINALKGSGIHFSRHDGGVSFSQCKNKILVSFFISIIWRAANSKNKAYKKISLSPPDNESIRAYLHSKEKITQNTATVKISRLIDNTDGGFTAEHLKGLLISPFIREHEKNKSFCLVLQGFFVEIFIPGIPVKDRYRLGVISPSSNSLFIPYLDVFDIPEISRSFATGFRKNSEGLISFKT
jgi:hypothetical protein